MAKLTSRLTGAQSTFRRVSQANRRFVSMAISD
jgi:hypothetical protein